MWNKGAVSDLVIGALPLLRSMHRLSRRWRDSVLSPFCRS
jgi:hypothetical protein